MHRITTAMLCRARTFPPCRESKEKQRQVLETAQRLRLRREPGGNAERANRAAHGCGNQQSPRGGMPHIGGGLNFGEVLSKKF